MYLQSEQVHLINQFIVVQVNSEHFYIRSHEYFNSLKSSFHQAAGPTSHVTLYSLRTNVISCLLFSVLIQSKCTLIASKVYLLASNKVKRQTLLTLTVHAPLLTSDEGYKRGARTKCVKL